METEHTYLASLVKGWARGESAAPAPPAGLVWPRLGQLMVDHLVVTALAPLLRAAPLPVEFRAQLDVAARETGRESGMLLLELERILPPLETAGCAPIVLKGAGLALTMYPAPEQRFCSDLDLLVPRDRLERADETLRVLGYVSHDTGRAPVFYEKHHFHRLLRSPAGAVTELHWALTLPDSCYRFDLDGLRARATARPLARVGSGKAAILRMPAPRDQLLHAVMQCIADGFVDLRRVMDTVLLLRAIEQEGEDEIAALAAQARAHGTATGLWLLLRITREIAAVTPPQVLLEALRPGPIARRALAGLRPDALCLTRAARARPHLTVLLHWLCAPGFAVAVREVGRFLVPSEASLLDAGHAPGHLPGHFGRVRSAIHRARAALSALGSLAGSLFVLGQRS